MRNLRRRFLTNVTADLHLAEASADGFLASITKSFNILSILIIQFEFATLGYSSERIGDDRVFGDYRVVLKIVK